MGTMMPVMLSMAMAAMQMPYSPASPGASRIPTPMTRTGMAVASMPMARPAMMLVAWPVCDAAAMVLTGQNCEPVKYSVMPTSRTVMAMPMVAHQNRL